MNEKQKKLIDDYLSDKLDENDKKEVEALIASGKIDFMQYQALKDLNHELDEYQVEVPADAMRARFYAMLNQQKSSVETGSGTLERLMDEIYRLLGFFTMPRLAYALTFLLLGGIAGYQFNSQDSEIDRLSAEVRDMREMMLVNVLEGASASDRLKAVNISSELPSINTEALYALLFTLNNDPSINVRVQAVQALKRWGDDDRVRQGMVRSIIKQSSPIVIVELADAMIEMGLKSSAPEFQKLLQERELDFTVQKKLENSIEVLM